VKAFALITICLFLLVGCASHGTWSRWDRGGWTSIDDRIGSHEQAYYVKEWGEPVSRREIKSEVVKKFKSSNESGYVTADGEELLWLWKADGTGPSDQPGQGWELFLEFNERGMFQNWRSGTYRSTVALPDVIAASRKFQYRFGEDLIRELGISRERHEIGEISFWNIPNRNPRKNEIVALQNTVRAISAATFQADTVARNLYDRLATESEIVDTFNSQAKSVPSAKARRQPAQGTSSPSSADNTSSSSSFLGRGFLGPYTPNAYGPGMNADATGRPFIWQPQGAGPQSFDPFLKVKPNAYGPGIGMDQYGRPVRPACPPGWAGPC